MLEILNFVFSSFWTWLGSFLLLAIVATTIANVAHSFRRRCRHTDKDD